MRFHSVAGISLKNGKYFIAKRLPGGGLGEKWEFPGGKLEAGEECVAALVREYQEEFGASIRVLMPICEVEFQHNGKTYALDAYFIEFDTGEIQLNDHSEWRWASLEEIMGLDFADSDRKILPFLI